VRQGLSAGAADVPFEGAAGRAGGAGQAGKVGTMLGAGNAVAWLPSDRCSRHGRAHHARKARLLRPRRDGRVSPGRGSRAVVVASFNFTESELLAARAQPKGGLIYAR